MKTLKIWVIAVILIGLTNKSVLPVKAQSVSLGIWPPVLQVMIQPGKSITQVYKLNNFGDPLIVTSKVAPFLAEGELGNVTIVDCDKVEVISCESLGWFSFQNANLALGQAFFLGSGRNQEVVLKISVPEYASEGDYYNTLLFTTHPSAGEGDLRSRSNASIGSNILITVSKDGEVDRNIEITEFSAKKIVGLAFGFLKLAVPFFDSFEEIPVVLKVKNSGSAYTDVSGKVTLNGFPGLKSDFDIPSQNILAGSTRLLLASPSAELGSLIKQTSFFLPKGFYLGRYLLAAKITNEDGQDKEAQISFFALPLRLIFYLLLTSILFFSSVKLIRKKKKRRGT